MFEGMDAMQREFADAVATSDDVGEQIRCAAEAHIRHHARRALAAYVNTYEIPSLEEPWRTELIERRRAYARHWTELIERGVELGVCRVRSPRLAAFAIIDMGIGVARWYRVEGPLSEATIATLYGQMALRIVGVDAGADAHRDLVAQAGSDAAP